MEYKTVFREIIKVEAIALIRTNKHSKYVLFAQAGAATMLLNETDISMCQMVSWV